MEYIFIGWCKDEKNNSDKVWACMKIRSELNDFVLKTTYLTVNGRRGKKLQHRLITLEAYCYSSTNPTQFVHMDIKKLIHEKENKKSYARIPVSKLNEVYPNFEKDLESLACWGVLSS